MEPLADGPPCSVEKLAECFLVTITLVYFKYKPTRWSVAKSNQQRLGSSNCRV
jgi:hypothetical protein